MKIKFFIIFFVVLSFVLLNISSALAFTCSPGTLPSNSLCKLQSCADAFNCDAGQICSSKICACPTGKVFCGGVCVTGTCCPISSNVKFKINFSRAVNVNPSLILPDGTLVPSGQLVDLVVNDVKISDAMSILNTESTPYIFIRRHSGFIEFYAFGKINTSNLSEVDGVITIEGAEVSNVLDGPVNTSDPDMKIESGDSVIHSSPNQITFKLNYNKPGDGLRIYYSPSCGSGQLCVNNLCVQCGANQIICDGKCVDGNCCGTGACGSGGICVNNTCIKCGTGEKLCGSSCVTGNCCKTTDCPLGLTCQNNQCLLPPPPDFDGDKIPDSLEDVNGDGNLTNDDTDKDGIPNYQDVDDDGDGILTKLEDVNGNGNPNDDDSDGDSIPNYLEPNNFDLDTDGKANAFDSDDDGDKVLTANENPNNDSTPLNDDTDGDGIPNYLDGDDDGDRVPTVLEDTNKDGNPTNDNVDGDGKPNYLDVDDDNDGILTKNEDYDNDGDPSNDDTDRDGIPNYVDSDDDNDGIYTILEDANQDNNPSNDDADGDTIPDYLESNEEDIDNDGKANVLDDDDDGDGNLTKNESPDGDNNLFNDDSDEDGIPDYLDVDDDGDGILSKNEDLNGDGNYKNDDLDGDGVPNCLDTDDDGDYILTIDEDLNKNNNPDDDSDSDTVPDYLEPNNEDLDKDTYANYIDPDDDGDGKQTRDEDANKDGNLFNDDSDNDSLVDYLDSLKNPCPYRKVLCGNVCFNGECCDSFDCRLGETCTKDLKCEPAPNSGSTKIVQTPILPDIIELPVIPDEYIGEIGFAYPETFPSFEVKFPVSFPDGLSVNRIDLADQKGMIFRMLPFNVAPINGSTDTFDITITIPTGVSIGESLAYIVLNDGRSYEGTIHIVHPKKLVKSIIGNAPPVKIGRKAKVSKVQIIKKGADLRFKVYGKNFAHRRIIYVEPNGDVKEFEGPESPNPNTKVTLLPVTINADPIYRAVRSGHRILRLKFGLVEDLKTPTKTQLIIATPQYILTKEITLKPGKQNKTIKFK